MSRTIAYPLTRGVAPAPDSMVCAASCAGHSLGQQWSGSLYTRQELVANRLGARLIYQHTHHRGSLHCNRRVHAANIGDTQHIALVTKEECSVGPDRMSPT